MRSKKAIYNIATNLILQLVVLLYGFIVPKLIINSYGSSVNGLVSSITQFLAYITLIESGIGPVARASLYKPLADKDEKTLVSILKSIERFFRTIAIIFIGYIIILTILYPLLVSKEFDFLFTSSLILIISISTFVEYYFGMTYRVLIHTDQKSYVTHIIQIVLYIIATLTILIIARFNVSIHILKLISGIIFIFRPILLNVYVKKKYKLDFSNYDKSYKLKNKWDGLAQHIASVIHTKTDIMVLTFFSTLSEVSVYSVYRIVNNGIKSLLQSFLSGVDASWGDMIAKNEQNNLNKKFSAYEVIFFSLSTIVYSCALVLITPFIMVYTKNITDANYVRPLFGFLIVMSEFIFIIRQPYNALIKSAGHFKETRIGAWVECLTNIIISIVLVLKYGLVGVAIGTIIAMSIRTIEFVYYSNKYILKRNVLESVKKIIFIFIEVIIIILISNYLPFVSNISYINWIINAIMVGISSCIVVFTINYIFYKDEFKELIKIVKRIIKIKK